MKMPTENNPSVDNNADFIALQKALNKQSNKLTEEIQQSLIWLFTGTTSDGLSLTDIRQNIFKVLHTRHILLRQIIWHQVHKLNINKKSLIEAELPKGSKATIVGNTYSTKTELKKKMRELGFTITTSLEPDVSFILLANKPEIKDNFWDAPRFLFSEPQLEQVYASRKPGFLQAEEAGQAYIDNIRQLIWSNDPLNEAVALEIIKNGGLPDSLKQDLIVVAKTSRDRKVKDQARMFLKGKIAPVERAILSASVNLLSKRKSPFQKLEKRGILPAGYNIGQLIYTNYRRTGLHRKDIMKYDDGTSCIRKDLLEEYQEIFLKRPSYLRVDLPLTDAELENVLEMPGFKGNLKRVVLNGGLLSRFPKALLNHEQTLGILEIKNCALLDNELPSNFFELKKLREIKLEWNALKKVSDRILYFQGLRYFHVKSNYPLKISEAVKQLPNLKNFTASNGVIYEEPTS